MPFDEPLPVVSLDEGAYCLARFLEVLEVVQLEVLLLEWPQPPLRHSVALRLPDVGRAGPDAEPFELVGEPVRRVLVTNGCIVDKNRGLKMDTLPGERA